MNAQALRHMQQVAEFHLGAGFHALDRGPVDRAGGGEHFLGHVQMQAPYPDAVADGLAGVEDPLRLFGWHAINRLRTMIISQQQI